MSGVGMGSGGWSGSVLNVIKSNFIAGISSMSSGASNFTITIPDTGTTNYAIVVTVQNLIDGAPRHLHATVIAKTATSFTFQTAQITDTGNYKAQYLIYKL